MVCRCNHFDIVVLVTIGEDIFVFVFWKWHNKSLYFLLLKLFLNLPQGALVRLASNYGYRVLLRQPSKPFENL